MEIRRDVFQAIADPTRREIIDLIAFDTKNLNAIADNFDMSRQAISQHIRILEECGLVVIKKDGRERFCQAKLEKLYEINEWTERYRVFWTGKMGALRKFLDQESDALNRTAKGSSRIKRKNK
ncbi:MAG: winged helix-turn-helix transcriptional regulator [Bacteroidetes bacterium]|nr:winged helix-turn-helix transcriptional regulator [Bacteroidota bacterium]